MQGGAWSPHFSCNRSLVRSLSSSHDSVIVILLDLFCEGNPNFTLLLTESCLGCTQNEGSLDQNPQALEISQNEF